MDREAMVRRCPGARAIGPARLMDFRFIIMRDGVASVKPERGSVVHGLLWTLQLSDIPPLDLFEDVAEGLYTKTIRPVLKRPGSSRAFLYVGHTTETGLPLPAYLEGVLAAAADLDLPSGYRRELATWGRRGSRGEPFNNEAADAPAGPVKGVRPRFASPLDRR